MSGKVKGPAIPVRMLLLIMLSILCHSAAFNPYPPGPPTESTKPQTACSSKEDVQDIGTNITGHLTTVEEELKTKMDELETRLTSKLKIELLDELNKTIVDQVTQLAANILPFLAGLNATVSDLQLQMSNIASQQQQQAQTFSEQQRLLDDQNQSLQILNAKTDELRPLNCAYLWSRGIRSSGVYTLYPILGKPGIDVWCNMSAEGGWTVILSRRPQSIQENFSRDWEAYKKGFGSASAEYWIGLEALHAMTNRTKHRLHAEVVAVNGSSYSGGVGHFHVDDESSKYMLTAQDSYGIGDHFEYNNGRPFTTIDKDNDGSRSDNCALDFGGGGGWWYYGCGYIFPTGRIAETNWKKQMRWAINNRWVTLSHIVLRIQPQ